MKALTLHTALLPAILIASLATSGHAEVYQWQGEDGSTVYSDQKVSPDARSSAPAANTMNTWSSSQPATGTSIDALPQLEVVEEAYFSATPDPKTGTTDDTSTQQLTEAECQALYGLSCDRVNNWKDYALEACGTDERCSDPAYLDRKYRPRLLSELNAVARRAGIRKNNAIDDINLYLKKKYTNFCPNQAQRYCLNHFQNNSGYALCTDKFIAGCTDSRELDEVLADYRQLTPREQKQIVEKARRLVLSNPDDSVRYDQMLARLIDLMLTASALGL